MSEWIEFNVNKYIKVKLTDLGKAHLIKKAPWIKINSADKDGYFQFQMWEFVDLFGEITSIGMNKYYETTILINSKNLHPSRKTLTGYSE